MMADEVREKLLDCIKQQGDIVRKLKAAKASEKEGQTKNWSSVPTELESLNDDFADVSYVCGWMPSSKDAQLFDLCSNFPNGELLQWPHLTRWFVNMKSFTHEQRLLFPTPKGCLTPLAGKVELMCSFNSYNGNILDEKVRRRLVLMQVALPYIIENY